LKKTYFFVSLLSFFSLFFYLSIQNIYFMILKIIIFSAIGLYMIKKDKIYFYFFLYALMFNMIFFNLFIFNSELIEHENYKIRGNIKNNIINVKKINNKYPKNRLFINIKDNYIEDGIYNFNIKIINNHGKIIGEIINSNTDLSEKFVTIFENKIESYTRKHPKDFLDFYTLLVTGNKNHQNKDELKKYAYTGISHLMVISGMHFGIIFFILMYILELFSISYKKKYIMLIFITTLYVFLCRFEIPVVRSYIMAMFLIIARLNHERYCIKKSFVLCYIIHIHLNPLNIYNVSFQLSYVAVFALIYMYPIFKTYVNTDNISKTREMFYTGIVVQVAMLPLSIYYFGKLPFLSLFANIFLSIFFTLLMIIFILNFIIGIFSIKLATIFCNLSYFAYSIFQAYIDFFNKIPFMSIDIN